MKTPFRYSLLAAALLLGFAGAGQAHDPANSVDGYVDDIRHSNITSAYTRCVRTGYWTPSLARPECDGGPSAAAPVELKRAPAPVAEVPPAAPEPVAAAVPVAEASQASAGATAPGSVISGEVLFDFNRFELTAQAKAKLDSLVDQLRLFRLEQLIATGHADRIGSEAYNQRLSEKRAVAVKDYLVEQGIDAQLIEALGRGESESATDGACSDLGPENRFNRRLVECLQPDRRVGVEASGSRPQVSSR